MKSLDKKKPSELFEGVNSTLHQAFIGAVERDKKKTKELEYVITWVMAKANGIDDYNWGQKQFEKDLRKKLELLLTQQRTELLEEILGLDILKEEPDTNDYQGGKNYIRENLKEDITNLLNKKDE